MGTQFVVDQEVPKQIPAESPDMLEEHEIDQLGLIVAKNGSPLGLSGCYFGSSQSRDPLHTLVHKTVAAWYVVGLALVESQPHTHQNIYVQVRTFSGLELAVGWSSYIALLVVGLPSKLERKMGRSERLGLILEIG
jgi:hypothetical protein